MGNRRIEYVLMVGYDVVIKDEKVHIYLEDGVEIEISAHANFGLDIEYLVRANRHSPTMGNIPASVWEDVAHGK